MKCHSGRPLIMVPRIASGSMGTAPVQAWRQKDMIGRRAANAQKPQHDLLFAQLSNRSLRDFVILCFADLSQAWLPSVAELTQKALPSCGDKQQAADFKPLMVPPCCFCSETVFRHLLR